MANPRFLIIIGSTRRQRIGPDVARWVEQIGMESVSATFEIVDLRDWPLPMDDEPNIPAAGPYSQPHTLAWSRKVDEAGGFVFVTPQYNWGYPAPLKNAIDHLYAEWRGKPAAIITYGGHGGDKCARQLREVLSGLKMQVVKIMPELTLSSDQVRGNFGSIDPETEFVTVRPTVVAALQELAGLPTAAKL